MINPRRLFNLGGHFRAVDGAPRRPALALWPPGKRMEKIAQALNNGNAHLSSLRRLGGNNLGLYCYFQIGRAFDQDTVCVLQLAPGWLAGGRLCLVGQIGKGARFQISLHLTQQGRDRHRLGHGLVGQDMARLRSDDKCHPPWLRLPWFPPWFRSP